MGVNKCARIGIFPLIVILFVLDGIYHTLSILNSYSKGPSRAFSGRGICHFLRRDIGKLGFKIAEYGIRYTHGTGNVLIFLLGKREKS